MTGTRARTCGYIHSVDGPVGARISSARLEKMLRNGCAIAALALAVGGCASRGVPATLDPPLADDAIASTAPDRPLRVIFDWQMLDGEVRFSGSGAARIEPRYRARLDLFGPRGEAYLSAALVDHRIRLPPGSGAVPLPPPAMMWGVLGVVAPPPGATLVGTRVRGDETVLYYAMGAGRLRYRLEQGRLASVTWDGDGRMDVELSGAGPAGLPANAMFRDWSGYTELRITVEEVDEVDPFPEEIWTPGG